MIIQCLLIELIPRMSRNQTTRSKVDGQPRLHLHIKCVFGCDGCRINVWPDSHEVAGSEPGCFFIFHFYNPHIGFFDAITFD